MYVIEGQVEHIGEPEIFNKKEEKKIDVVITTKNSSINNRREYVKIEFMRENVSMIAEKFLEVGDLVCISFQIVGRKFNKDGSNMYFNNLQGLSIEML